MKLDEICRQLNLVDLTPELAMAEIDVTSGYVSDLLSDVLAHASQGGVLVTVQVHMNVVAVAVHSELGAVIFAGDRRPEEVVRRKAIEEKVPLLGSSQLAFELVGRLYAMGVGGNQA